MKSEDEKPFSDHKNLKLYKRTEKRKEEKKEDILSDWHQMRQMIDLWVMRNRHCSITVRVRKGSLKIEMSSLMRRHDLFEHTTEQVNSCSSLRLVLYLCNQHKKCTPWSVCTAHLHSDRDHKMSLSSVLSGK